MANSNENDDSFNYQPFPLELIHWPLDFDIDDDEFRAGYPFDNISESESSEYYKLNDLSLISADNVHELNKSDDNCISKEEEEEENKQTIDSICEEQKVENDIDIKSSLTVEYNETQQPCLQQMKNHDEEKCNDELQRNNLDEFYATNNLNGESSC